MSIVFAKNLEKSLGGDQFIWTILSYLGIFKLPKWRFVRFYNAFYFVNFGI